MSGRVGTAPFCHGHPGSDSAPGAASSTPDHPPMAGMSRLPGRHESLTGSCSILAACTRAWVMASPSAPKM